MKLKLLLYVLFITTITFAQNESDFYNPWKNGNINRTIDNLTGVKSNADSNTLQAAIEDLSNTVAPNGKMGGVLTLRPNGNITTYYLERIDILSNVHLKIDPSITIESVTNSTMIFRIGEIDFAENVALSCVDEDATDKTKFFKVQLRAEPNAKEFAVRVGYVKNFKISGIDIYDNFTKISGIAMSTQARTTDKTKIPTKGVVKNLRIENAHVGYGLIQAQASKNVYFLNLYGKGGITLRFESGDDPLLKTTNSSVDKVYGRNITVVNGDAALNLSPHRSNQGSVEVVGVKAFGATWAVQCAAGFIGVEGTEDGAQDNKGTYSSVKIQIANISGKENKAQIKSKDFKYFNCDVDYKNFLIDSYTQEVKDAYSSVRGRSIGGSRATASVGCVGGAEEGCYNVDITYPAANKVTGVFQLSGDTSYGAEVPACNTSIANMPNEILDFNQDLEIQKLSVSPNPATDTVVIKAVEGSVIRIYNAFGQLIKTIPNANSINRVNLNGFISGLYMVSSETLEGKVSTVKLMIQ